VGVRISFATEDMGTAFAYVEAVPRVGEVVALLDYDNKVHHLAVDAVVHSFGLSEHDGDEARLREVAVFLRGKTKS
jgi:hypothetical protein